MRQTQLIGVIGTDVERKSTVLEDVGHHILDISKLERDNSVYNVVGTLYDARLISHTFELTYTEYYLVLIEFESCILRSLYCNKEKSFSLSLFTPIDILVMANYYGDFSKTQYNRLLEMSFTLSNYYDILVYMNTAINDYTILYNELWNKYYSQNKSGRKETKTGSQSTTYIKTAFDSRLIGLV